jgi:hypothetical protein
MKPRLLRPKFRFIIVILASILVAAVTLESMTFRISEIVFEPNSNVRLINFSITAAICMSIELALVVLLRKKVETGSFLHYLRGKHVFIIMLVVQIVMLSLVLVTILQMQYFTKYQLIIIRISVMASYSSSTFFILLLLLQQTQWLHIRHNLVMLTYAITMGTIILNFASGMIYLIDELENDPNVIRPLPFPPHVLHVEKGDGSLKNLYLVSYTIVFVCTWMATVTLLQNYSQRLGRIRYWLIVVLPLMYFFVQYEPFLTNKLATYSLQDTTTFEMWYVLLTNVSKPIGGIIFGIAFILISSRLGSKGVKEYLILSAMGFMLMFASNQSDILISPTYPPYGILGLSALPISSFLILIGIYSTAVSISKDALLRRDIMRYLNTDSHFLESLGNSELQQSIKKKVFIATKRLSNQLPEYTGIESSFDDLDIQSYINEVYELLKVSKNIKSNSDHG